MTPTSDTAPPSSKVRRHAADTIIIIVTKDIPYLVLKDVMTLNYVYDVEYIKKRFEKQFSSLS